MSNLLVFLIAAIVAFIVVRLILRSGNKGKTAHPPPIRYKATLYNNGEIVKTIRATQGSASASGVWMLAEGAKEHTVGGGTLLIEPLI